MFTLFTGSNFGRGINAQSGSRLGSQLASYRRTRAAVRRPTPLHTIIAA